VKVGQHVDWVNTNSKKQSGFWHGIIIKIEGNDVHVLWLLSNSKRNRPPGNNNHPYHLGYETVEVKSELRLCNDGLVCSNETGDLHPKQNPWGRKFGVALKDAG